MDTYMDRVVGENVYEFWGRQFPVQVKHIRVKGKMPLRVHPDAETAKDRYDFLGREKLWYVLRAGADARLLLGFKEDTDASALYTKCMDGSVAGLLNSISPKAGDFFHIRPGVPHAAAGDVEILEISESSPLDFCLCGWGEEVSPDEFDASLNLVDALEDDAAASMLTRSVAPWLVGPCDWTPKFIRKAVVWLCQTVGKPILKLTEKDYLDNNLSELLEQVGSFDKINIDVFNDLQHTITGWPGGKPGATDDATRPVRSEPYPKTVLLFSPHPDDDVISMGGTFIRLVTQGHDVHVAYETSGNVAVNDDFVLQMIDCSHLPADRPSSCAPAGRARCSCN